MSKLNPPEKLARQRTGYSRRDMLLKGGVAGVAATGLATDMKADAAAGNPVSSDAAKTSAGELYRAIGVNPVINAHGTLYHHHRLGVAAPSEASDG